MSLRIERSIDLSGLAAAAEEGIATGLPEAIEHVRGVAVARTPVETGRLAGSASVHLDAHEAAITYDGPYARYQHERLDLRHEQGGQAKFLETALITEADTALDIIATAVRRAL